MLIQIVKVITTRLQRFICSCQFGVYFKIINNSLSNGNNKQGKGKVVPVYPMDACERNESVTSLILNLRARWKILVQITPRPLTAEKKSPVPFV
jgi:hypothetical protein